MKTLRQTSELRDERHHVVLLEDLLQLQLHVLIHVGLERALQHDPPRSQDVVEPVRDAEHRPT